MSATLPESPRCRRHAGRPLRRALADGDRRGDCRSRLLFSRTHRRFWAICGDSSDARHFRRCIDGVYGRQRRHCPMVCATARACTGVVQYGRRLREGLHADRGRMAPRVTGLAPNLGRVRHSNDSVAGSPSIAYRTEVARGNGPTSRWRSRTSRGQRCAGAK